MPAGCILHRETEHSIQLVVGDINDGIGRIKAMSAQLSENHPEEALSTGSPLLSLFMDLNDTLVETDSLETIHETGPFSGGGIKNRMFTRPAVDYMNPFLDPAFLGSPADD
jgi:hypothetical protein